MDPVLYSELTVDGVRGSIYDEQAIHGDQLSEALADALITADIKSVLLNMFFPVDSYHITADNTNPSQYFGGQWTAVEGRVLLGASADYPVDSTGGSADAIVVQHNHNATGTVESGGSHSHMVTGTAATGGAHHHSYIYTIRGTFKESGDSTQHNSAPSEEWKDTTDAGSHSHTVSGTADSANTAHTHPITISVNAEGESGTGKNMMPYVAAYIWKRTA